MTPWEEADCTRGQGKQAHSITWTHKGPLLPTGLPLPPSSPPPSIHRCNDGRTPVLSLGLPARGLEFTEHSPACCGNNSGIGVGGRACRWGGRGCARNVPSEGREGESSLGLSSLLLLCPGAGGGLCLWTNTACLGNSFLPHTRPCCHYTQTAPTPYYCVWYKQMKDCREQRQSSEDVA